MATMVYANPGWTNGSPPALNKTNLDLLSNALASIGSAGSASVRDSDKVAGTTPGARGLTALASASTLDADTVTSIAGNKLWYASSGTGGSDGNGGQPPAPKPNGTATSKTTMGFGQTWTEDVATTVTPAAPAATGTYWYCITSYGAYIPGGYTSGTAAGNSGNLPGAMSGANGRIIWWRVA